jgi:DNA-binding transcriptional MocR family regulator
MFERCRLRCQYVNYIDFIAAMDSPTPPPLLSERIARLEPSPIREILAVLDRPGMISFAGGLPAPACLPRLAAADWPRASMQYGATEGEPALRERVARDLADRGLRCDPAEVLILSGSQQGIDLVAKLFVDAGTPIALEYPTYLAALQVFGLFGARYLPLRPEAPLESLSGAVRPAFAYAIPTFGNPTGRCLDAAERRALARACDALAVPLFEDDPYRDLAYDPCEREPVCAQLRRASWIYQGSFSKSLAPGLRIGYLAASADLAPLLARLKQAADLHTSRVGQWLVMQCLDDPGHDERLAEVVALYRARRDAFASALRRHFGDLARWQVPPGGLFFWLELANRIDTRRLLPHALARGVAFMPGEPFHADRPQAVGRMRLNFSHADPDRVDHGLTVLAELVRDGH